MAAVTTSSTRISSRIITVEEGSFLCEAGNRCDSFSSSSPEKCKRRSHCYFEQRRVTEQQRRCVSWDRLQPSHGAQNERRSWETVGPRHMRLLPIVKSIHTTTRASRQWRNAQRLSLHPKPTRKSSAAPRPLRWEKTRRRRQCKQSHRATKRHCTSAPRYKR